MTYVKGHNFIKAVKFIYQNLDGPINLEVIAENIGVSVLEVLKKFLVTVHDAPEIKSI
jgi:hypothetical protein